MSLAPREETAGRSREILVLSLVPGLVGIAIALSWAMARWGIGPAAAAAGIAVAATLFGGFTRFVAGVRDLLRRRVTVNVFVTVALACTLALGEFRPAAVIVFIMTVVGALESYTLDKGRRSIRNLLGLAPPTATVRRGEEEVVVPLDEVRVGDLVRVRPGERIPVDGVVSAGSGAVNQAPITGESMPVEKFAGSEVYSGTLNETGRLEIRTVRTGADTTLARIVHLVEEAQETRAPIQAVADRFTTWFLPAVLVLAALGYGLSGDLRVASSVLLVACPCAFAIATPTAVTAGIANMARRAVLVKGGVFFERAGRIDTLLVDKTGTLTFGRPKAVRVLAADGRAEDEVLRFAAIAEKCSEHPLARSVMALAVSRGIAAPDPEDFKGEVGRGVTASRDGRTIVAGRKDFLRERGVAVPDRLARSAEEQAAEGRTVILVAVDGAAIGLLAVADEVRPETDLAVRSLRAMGVRQIVMLTGDNSVVAGSVARAIGVDDVRAGLLPEQKQAFVRQLKDEGRVVGMVGDGINDAPSLALADVGIVMGSAGTDVAIEAADVVLMNDDLSRIAEFVWMSRKVLRRIKLNLFFSIVYNAVGLFLGVLGLLTPVLAVVFQEAGCVSVVASSTLLLWVKPRVPAFSLDLKTP